MQIETEKPIKIKITHQGAVVVDRAFVIKAGRNVLAAVIDLHSKYCIIDCTGDDNGTPTIMLCACDNSLRLDKNKNSDEPTHITLTGLIGWGIFAAETSKSSVRICLTKN